VLGRRVCSRGGVCAATSRARTTALTLNKEARIIPPSPQAFTILEVSMNDLHAWQVVDSAFPMGSFPHSGGLEAAWRAGEVDARRFEEFLRSTLHQCARGLLPFVLGVRQRPSDLDSLDARCDAFLSNHVARRASSRQGRALISSFAAIFRDEAL